jgi:hypothetical protein
MQARARAFERNRKAEPAESLARISTTCLVCIPSWGNALGVLSPAQLVINGIPEKLPGLVTVRLNFEALTRSGSAAWRLRLAGGT